MSTEPGRQGLGAVVKAAYLIFAVAAGGRSVVQWWADPNHDRLAHALSLVAFCFYLAGYLLARSGPPAVRARRVLFAVACLELTGVITVGSLDFLTPGLVGSTIWSHFGAGYGLAPLLIPVAMIVWVRRGHLAVPIDGSGSARSAPLPLPRR